MDGSVPTVVTHQFLFTFFPLSLFRRSKPLCAPPSRRARRVAARGKPEGRVRSWPQVNRSTIEIRSEQRFALVYLVARV